MISGSGTLVGRAILLAYLVMGGHTFLGQAPTPQQQHDQAKANTTQALKESTLTSRYFLLQDVRQNPPNSAGISSTSAGQVIASDVVSSAQADQTYEPFGAAFDLLGSFTDAGNGAYPSAQSGIQTEALGKIAWESQHYGYKNTFDAASQEIGYKRRPDFSFGGSIGLYPALVLENLTSTTTTIAQPNARPMFQDSFNWYIGPRMNVPLFSHGEASIFGDFGQYLLIDQVTSFKEGDNTITATPVSNGVGRAASYREGGLEARILSTPIWLAHDDKYDNLRPLFLVASGVRRDTRLQSTGDLAAFGRSEDRVFFRFFVNLTSVVAYSDAVKKAAPASIRFGIDMDAGMFSQRIPTATRYFVSADFNIMQVFKPSSTGQ